MKLADKQNLKIEAIDTQTLVIGCDIGKFQNFVRAVDYRGMEYGKALSFDNSRNGFESLLNWMTNLQSVTQKNKIILGVEPTGHYWLPLAEFLRNKTSVQLVLVNSYHVKRTKEIDDNSPTKNDKKDALVIAKMIKDGRYFVPVTLEGIYSELRDVMTRRDDINRMRERVCGHIQVWLDRYFPEFCTVFKSWEGKAALLLLKHAPLPQQIVELGAAGVSQIWRQQLKQGVRFNRANDIWAVAKQSVGLTSCGSFAQYDLRFLLEQYEFFKGQMDAIMAHIQNLLQSLPEAAAMLSIPGVGEITVAGFLAEVGDLKNYTHWRQINRLAGLNLKENSSGLHKGKTTISKRGRPRLRALLYRCAIMLVAKNPEMKVLHHYLTNRPNNPLKKKQSLIAICGKLIRMLFALGKKQTSYQANMALGKHRIQQLQLAA